MRHLKKKKFGKGSQHRKKLLRTLASSLFLYEKVRVAYANGRACKSYAEKLITKAKDQTLAARRHLLASLSPMAAKKAYEVLGPKYSSRKGGYTRLIKTGDPKKDSSKVILELVD